MLWQISIGRVRFCAVLAPIVLASCQTYQPMPLDLQSHAAAWRARSASSGAVQAFVERLAESGAAPEAPFDLSDGLDVHEAEQVAMVFNAELRLARAHLDLATDAARHAGLWDDPEIGIDLLKITRSVPDPWVVGSALTFNIPISGRLEAEKKRATAAQKAELDRVAEQEWRVRQLVRSLWIRWSSKTILLDETERLLSALADIARIASKLAEAGELPRTQAALFAIERISLQSETELLRGEARDLELELRRAMGLSPDAPLEMTPSLQVADPDDDSQAWTESNLTLRRLKSEYAVAEQVLLREIRKQYPDLAIGPQYEDDQGQSRIGFVGAVPIPILNANKGGIAEAKRKRDIARAAYETGYEKIAGRLASLRLRLRSARRQKQLIQATLVPLVDRQIADARRLMEIGEGDGLVLMNGFTRAHDAKERLIALESAIAQTLDEIQRLIGPRRLRETEPMDREVNP